MKICEVLLLQLLKIFEIIENYKNNSMKQEPNRFEYGDEIYRTINTLKSQKQQKN